MKFFQKLLDIFKTPQLWLLIPVILISIGSLIASTLILTDETLLSYINLGYALLGISAVTTGYSVYAIIKSFPLWKECVLKWSERQPFMHKLFNHYGFRTILFSSGSFAINIAFAFYNGAVGILTYSLWFGALAAYYIVLIFLRGGILIYHSRRKKAVKNGQTEEITLIRDMKVYRNCSILLLLLPIALSFAILQMVRAGDSFVHTGITIYVYAIYAFYKIIMSIYNLVKTRKTQEMTLRASKSINLADAMVSILALQTAMFREFVTAEMDVNTAMMNAVTGAVVCALTIAIGIFMLINATRKLKTRCLTDNKNG